MPGKNILQLPPELIDEIMHYLTLYDLVESRLVSKAFQKVVDTYIWEQWLRKKLESYEQEISNPLKELEKAGVFIKGVLDYEGELEPEEELGYKETQIIQAAKSNPSIAVAAVFYARCDNLLYNTDERGWSKIFRQGISNINPKLTEEEIFTLIIYHELSKKDSDFELVDTLKKKGAETNARQLNIIFYEQIKYRCINKGLTNRAIRLGGQPNQEKIFSACLKNLDESNFFNAEILKKYLEESNIQKIQKRVSTIAHKHLENLDIDTARGLVKSFDVEIKIPQATEILSQYLKKLFSAQQPPKIGFTKAYTISHGISSLRLQSYLSTAKKLKMFGAILDTEEVSKLILGYLKEILFSENKLLVKRFNYNRADLKKCEPQQLVELCLYMPRAFKKEFRLTLGKEEINSVLSKYFECLDSDKNSVLQELDWLSTQERNRALVSIGSILAFDFDARLTQAQKEILCKADSDTNSFSSDPFPRSP